VGTRTGVDGRTVNMEKDGGKVPEGMETEDRNGLGTVKFTERGKERIDHWSHTGRGQNRKKKDEAKIRLSIQGQQAGASKKT